MTVLAPAVDRSLDEIVPRLLKRFSSSEGYKLYDDTIPTCECPLEFDGSRPDTTVSLHPIVQRLRSANIRTGVISNTDARMRELCVPPQNQCIELTLTFVSIDRAAYRRTAIMIVSQARRSMISGRQPTWTRSS